MAAAASESRGPPSAATLVGLAGCVAVVVSRRTFDRLREKRGQFSETYQQFLERFSLDEIGFDRGELAPTRDKTAGRRVRL